MKLSTGATGPESLTDVDIRLVRVFCGVVKCGGMAAAELELDIGRSTISRHVKELEERLGTVLCRRGRSGFALTADGSEVYAAAGRLLAALDQFQAEVSGLHREMSGNLNLAFFDKTVTNPAARLHRAIADFNERAPDVTLQIHVDPVNEIERRVIEGEYQLGVIPTHRSSTSLRYLPLFDEQMYLYCGNAHPLYRKGPQATRDEVLGCRYAGMGFHSPNMEIGQGLGWERRATAYDQEAIATLIRSGRYVGFLPDHYARFFVERDEMRRLGDDTFQYRCEFAAIVRRSPAPSRILAEFLACLERQHGH